MTWLKLGDEFSKECRRAWRGGVVTELKPLECPYCGGQVLAVVESVRAGQIVAVECDDCGAAWAPDGGPVSGPVRVETRRAAQ